jgi:hypothetical protein
LAGFLTCWDGSVFVFLGSALGFRVALGLGSALGLDTSCALEHAFAAVGLDFGLFAANSVMVDVLVVVVVVVVHVVELDAGLGFGEALGLVAVLGDMTAGLLGYGRYGCI